MRRAAAFRYRIEDVESPLQVISKFEYGSFISASVAVVRCRPNSNEVLITVPVLEPFVDQLMGPANQFNVIQVIELKIELIRK